jgi:hypothetical protein
MADAINELEMASQAQRDLLGAVLEELYHSVNRLLFDHGEIFDAAPLPPDVEAGEQHCCFFNAFSLASQRPESYTYFEGVATYEPEASRWPVGHAWCVDMKGRVVDPTWLGPTIRPLAYLGVPLPAGLVEPYAYKFSHGTFHALANDVAVVYEALGLPLPESLS